MLGNDADRGRVLCLCDWIGSGPLCEPVDECLLAEGRVVPALPRHHHHHAPSGGTLPLGPSHGGRETDGTVAIGGVRLVGPEYVDQVEELLRVARAQAQLRRDIRHVARAETRREIRRIVNRRAEDIV